MMTTTVSREGGWRMSWGAVFGGAIVTLGLWLLLHTLGLAAGLTAIDPQDQGSLRGIGIGTGIWSVIAPLLALFAGGFVAARTAGLVDRLTGSVHGLVVWGLTTLLGTVLVVLALATTMRAGLTAAGGVPAVQASDLRALGLDSADLLAPVNQRLQREGAPPVTAGQLQAAAQDTLSEAVRQGRFDRDLLASALARNTAMTRQEALGLAQQLEGRMSARATELRQDALTAADRAGKALWGLFLALLLGAIAAVGGAMLGSRHRLQVEVEQSPTSRGGRPVPAHSQI